MNTPQAAASEADEFQNIVNEEFKTADPVATSTQGPGVAEITAFHKRATDAVKTDLHNRFTYHAPKPGQRERYEAIREKALELAMLVVDATPFAPEQTLAIRKIEEAVFWANASIARNE